ncbi:hypothetical protein AMOR_37590 [Anaeromyxobacter oryzae]|uniref:Uncharacterized protein n=1 Tax=Anaeromyxobacter oryzae TaxID=2918170 RepID=A0ABM7WYY3_9BACT|nr:hypothetical protein AMOR_37590 [Anaeromyxobacter oryzae]
MIRIVVSDMAPPIRHTGERPGQGCAVATTSMRTYGR